MSTFQATISELYPFEPSAVRPAVDARKRQLEAGTADPIDILVIGNEKLVVEGNNTVQAAIELGLTQVEARYTVRDKQSMPVYEGALVQAKQNGLKGFFNFPIDDSKADRAKRY